jgi:DNA polymerase-1
MGHVAPDPTIVDIFKQNKDMHTVTSAAFLNKEESEITKDERLKGKGSNFGFMFGMGPLKFIKYAFVNFGLSVTMQEAEEMRNSYMALYRGVKAMHNRNSAILNEHREFTAKTMLGRQMRCDKFTNSNNYPVQGTAADIFKLANVILFHRARAQNVPVEVINLIHDEIVAQAPRKYKKEAMALIKEAMEVAINYVLDEFKTEVEVEEIKMIQK